MKRYITLAAVCLLAVLLGAQAQAQQDVAITMAENGNFSYPGCSQYSPQFSYAASVPANCRNTITLWVTNVGAVPTAGQVTVVDTFLPGQSRAGTILSMTGNGWACTLNGVCTRSDALAPGRNYPAIIMTVLVEDFATPPLNNLATVALAGDTNLANNTAFDSNVIWPPILSTTDISGKPVPTSRLSQLVVHTVPEGLFVYVNGEKVKTPHTYISPIDFGNPPTSPQMMFSISATDYNGNAIPDNAPWTFKSVVSGGTTLNPPFRAGTNPVDFFMTGTWYEHVTLLFER